MSDLELYTPITDFSAVAAVALLLISCALIIIEVKIHLMCSYEVERLKANIDTRITALQTEIATTMNRLAPLEDATKTLLATQEDVETELWNIDTALKGHGEELALTAVAAYAPYVVSKGAYHSPLDDYINDYLKASTKATVTEIFTHLNENTALTEAWPKLYGEKAAKFTLQDVHRRLHSRLWYGKLKMDSSEGPVVWSL